MEGQTIVVSTHEDDNATHNVEGNTQMEISIINNGSVTNIIDASGNTLSRQEDDVIAVLGQLFESAEDTLQQMAEAAHQIDPRRSAPEEQKSGGTQNRPFVCECGKTYTCKSHLKYHQKVHDNIRPYVCDVCNLSFLQLGHLRRHSRIHTLDKPYKCDVCNKAFRQSSHLTCHLRIHTNEKPYKCEVCSQGFRQKSAVYRHIQRMHIKEKVYVCSLCDKGYSGEADLRRHEKTHVNITYFAVMNLHTKLSKICGHIEEDDAFSPEDKGGVPQENKENDNAKQQTSNTSQQQTIVTRNRQGINTAKKQTMVPSKRSVINSVTVNHVNADNTTLTTGLNQKANFTVVDGVLVPLIQADDPARPFKCDVCNKSYKSKGHLKFHYKVHQMERPFECPFCGKGFLQKGHLRRHVLVHTEEKPYVCADCDKVFRQISHLNDHKKIHANIRPCVCHICSKGFRQTSALKRHIIRMHATQKMFACMSCDKTYRLESDLKRHQATTCNKDKPKRVPKPRKSKSRSSRHRNTDAAGEGTVEEDNGGSDSCNASPEKAYQRQAKNSYPRKMFNCEICDKPCRSKADRKIHMRIHNNEKPFQCGICHSIFRQLAHLKHHMLIHTGERPYSCQHCSKAFRGNSALTRHIDRMHPVEKKFACGICPKACASEADIKRHRKSHRTEKDGIEGGNTDEGGDENDADVDAGELPEHMDTTEAATDAGGNVAEVEKQLPEVENQLPEVENQLPEVENQLPEVESQLQEMEDQLQEVENQLIEVDGSLPTADGAKVQVGVLVANEEGGTGEVSLKEGEVVENLEGTQEVAEGLVTSKTEK